MRLFSKKSYCNYYGHYGSKSDGAVGIFIFECWKNPGCRMGNNNKTFHNSTIYFKAINVDIVNTKNANTMNLTIFQK